MVEPSVWPFVWLVEAAAERAAGCTGRVTAGRPVRAPMAVTVAVLATRAMTESGEIEIVAMSCVPLEQ